MSDILYKPDEDTVMVRHAGGHVAGDTYPTFRERFGLASFSPRDYGSVGTSDDTGVLNGCLAAAGNAAIATGRKQAVLWDRAYRISLPSTQNHGGLIIPSNVVIMSFGATIYVDTNGVGSYRAILGIGTSTVPATGVEIWGLTVDGLLSGTAGNEFVMGAALYAGASDIRFMDCTFSNIQGDGINCGEIAAATDVANVTVSRNIFHHITGQAVTKSGAAGTGWKIDDNTLHDSSNSGGGSESFFIVADGCEISRNHVTSWGSIGIAANDITLDTNEVDRIDIDGDRIKVKGGIMHPASTTTGINIGGTCDDVEINGVTIKRADGKAAGITAAAAVTNLKIKGMTIDGGDVQVGSQPDILLNAACPDAKISGNHLNSVGTAAFYAIGCNGLSLVDNTSKYGAFIVQNAADVEVSINKINATNGVTYSLGGAGSPIHFQSVTDSMVTGNRLTVGLNSHGILLNDSSNNLVMGNSIKTPVAAIYPHVNEGGSSDYNDIIYNKCFGHAESVNKIGAHSHYTPIT